MSTRTPGVLKIDEPASSTVTKQADTNAHTRTVGGSPTLVQREVVSIGSPDSDTTEHILIPNADGSLPITAAALPLPTGAATDAAVAALTKPTDAQLVQRAARGNVAQNYVEISNQSGSEITILAADVGVFHDLTLLVIINASTVIEFVTIKDGTTGPTKFAIPLPARGGIVLTFDPAFEAAATGSNWTATLTGSATVEFTVQALKR